MIYPECDHCKSSRRKVKYNFGKYKLVQCRQCGLFYLCPRPDQNELKELYSGSYFTSNIRATNWAEDDSEKERLIKKKQPMLDYVQEYMGKGNSGTFLEIGCATGYLVELAKRRGFDARGIEISEYAASIARKLTMRPIFTGTIEDALEHSFILPNSIDVIVMSHVIEHVDSPRQTLNALFSALRSGGIAVVRCPDIGGLDAKLWGKKWEGLRVPYHFYHFTPASLQGYLTESGFEVLEIDFWIHKIIKLPILKIKNMFDVIRQRTRRCRSVTGPKLNDRVKINRNAKIGKRIKRMLYPFRGRSMTFVVKKP